MAENRIIKLGKRMDYLSSKAHCWRKRLVPETGWREYGFRPALQKKTFRPKWTAWDCKDDKEAFKEAYPDKPELTAKQVDSATIRMSLPMPREVGRRRR